MSDLNLNRHRLTKQHALIRLGTALLGIAAASMAGAQSSDRPRPEEIETLFISDQYTYDDNLFRLSESADLNDPLNAGIVSREDYINRLTIGVGEDLEIGRQVFSVQGRAQDVRFADNDHLDHLAGQGMLNWDWLVTDALTGNLGGRYHRGLADFANSRGTQKDVLETVSYDGGVRFKLGPRWAVFAGGQHSETEHGLELRRADDFESDMVRGGLQYTTPTQHTFALEYRFIDASFPNRLATSESLESGDYEESGALARIAYTFSVHTQLNAMYGYVEREQTQSQDERFSGNIWRAELAWQPRTKFSTKLAAWRELKAYVDAESDYFISEGFSITPSWSPIRQLSFDLALAWEDQEYLGFDALDPGVIGRTDEVFSGLATLVYSPRPSLDFELSYRAFDRESNRTLRQYDAAVGGLSVRWRIL